jgi:hypothetical protein
MSRDLVNDISVPTDTQTFPVDEPDRPVCKLGPVSKQHRKYVNPPRSYSRISARCYFFRFSPSELAGEVKHLANKSTRPMSLEVTY